MFLLTPPRRNFPAQKKKQLNFSGTDMTGRPGYRTMEMIGGSSAPYLARTPCVPLFCTLFNRGGDRRAFRLPGAGGGSFSLYGGTFARSYLVSNFHLQCYHLQCFSFAQKGVGSRGWATNNPQSRQQSSPEMSLFS